MAAVSPHRAVLLALTVLAGLGVLSAGALSGSAQQPAQTLYERARKTGGRLVEFHEPDRRVPYRSLEELARHSDVIVVGRPLSNRGRLSPNGTAVRQEYTVRVQGVVKGAVRGGANITVSLPGGAHRFQDGTFVYTGPRDYKQAENGKLYVFFLKAKRGGYEPTAETRALFGLTGGKVEPADRAQADPLVAQYRGKDAPAFLEELHRAAGGRRKNN